MQLSDLTIYSSVIPAVCGLAVVRKITSPYRVFFIFCVVTVFTEFWALVLAGKQTNNLFIIHAHALMDCIIYTYLFSEFYDMVLIDKTNSVWRVSSVLCALY